MVVDFKFLDLRVTGELSWSTNTASMIGKAQQRLCYLKKLKHAYLPKKTRCHWECAVLLCVSTHKLHRCWSSCSAEGDNDFSGYHWGHSLRNPDHLPLLLPALIHQHHQGPVPSSSSSLWCSSLKEKVHMSKDHQEAEQLLPPSSQAAIQFSLALVTLSPSPKFNLGLKCALMWYALTMYMHYCTCITQAAFYLMTDIWSL